MGIINVLDFHVANLIAAGEVVDRPASVIKELLENAIDAGADAVTVEIKRGGVSFMRVTDNGCGIAREDVPVALKRHATSKIHAASDLDAIATLGFRGEALAAISSVSEIRIMTRREQDTVGTLMEAKAGRVQSVTDAGCPTGTTVIVENLFYNTPARLKFLKKDGTEGAAVSAYVEKIALSHPEIQIRFLSDGELKFGTAGDGIRYNAVYGVLGREFAKKTAEVKGGFDGIEVGGFIGTPENTRGNRNYQIFFINDRYIRSKTVAAALEQAFDTYIPSDKFPCAVLYIHMNPALVDVNVHPAKLECKFSNERLVFESVYYAVRGVLETRLARPQIQLYEDKKKAEQMQAVGGSAPFSEGRGGEKSVPVREMRQTLTQGAEEAENVQQVRKAEGLPAVYAEAQKTAQVTAKSAPHSEAFPAEYIPPDIPVPDAPPPVPLSSQPPADADTDSVITIPDVKKSFPEKESRKEKIQTAKDEADTKPLETESVSAEIPAYRIVGEVFQCYVILECGNTMYMVDKHAAHERILFEKFRAAARSREKSSQILLVPLTIAVTAEEADAAVLYTEELSKSGFVYTVAGHTATVTEIPSFLDTTAAQDAFCEAVARLADATGNASLSRDMRLEHALFQASCKAAIKGGKDYDPAHIRFVCDRVLSDPAIRYCPHGRPVCFELSKADIENRFGRT